MNFVLNLVLVAQILSALAMIGLILMQHGKGADMGTSFGSGASGSLFGATGSANFLSRATAALATVFFASTLILTYFGFTERPVANGGSSVLDAPAVSVPASAPAKPAGVEAIPTGTAAGGITGPSTSSAPTSVPAPSQVPPAASNTVPPGAVSVAPPSPAAAASR